MQKEKDYILYVDDDLNNLEIFKVLLEDYFNIVTESSTSKATGILQDYPFKVLISDQRMPEENGLAFIERISPLYPDLIKIIFTAHLDHEAAIKAVNQGGIYRYILKPWNTQEIKITLTNAIREYDLQVENKNLLQELKQMNADLIKAYNQVKESEHKFHSIFASSSDGIGIFKNNVLLEANPAFFQLFGYKGKELNTEELNTHIRNNYSIIFKKLDTASNESEIPFVEQELLIGNKKKYFELHNKPINYRGEMAILSIVRDITERKLVDQRIMEAIVQTQEEDQRKYACELHDGLGPILSTLKMYIEWMSDVNNTVNKDKISKQSIVGINEAISIVKEIANNLSPHILQRFGLINAIKSHIDNIKVASGIEFIVSSNINSRIPANIEIVLYRILLECINNTIKHARAKKVIIKFKIQDKKLAINYSDNGKGFDLVNANSSSSGMGLFNIQNRIKLIGGDIQIISNLGIGTDIELNVALNNE